MPHHELPADGQALANHAAGGSPQNLNRHQWSCERGALFLLAAMATLYTLHWAREICIPVLLGTLLSYVLLPFVDYLKHRGLRREFGAALAVVAIIGAICFGAYGLSEQAGKLVALLPQAAQKLNQLVQDSHLDGDGESTFTTVQKTAARLEQTATNSTQLPSLMRGVQRVQVERPHFDLKDYFWSGTLGLLNAVGQAVIVILITFLVLASGDKFRRKAIEMVGPDLSRQRVALQAFNQIQRQIQRYFLVQLLTSVMVGVATWLSFLSIGLANAGAWGGAAGLLDMVPYVGCILISSAAALVAFLQFGSLRMAILVGGCAVLIHSIESMLVTPWLTSRSNNMNPVAIFVGVLSWGWLWGIWGLLLGVPLLVAIKAICERIDGLKPIAELLGE